MKRFTTITVLVFVLFAGVHLVFTLFYVLPQNLVSKKLNEKSNAYMTPLFGQGWALFAPVPKINHKTFVTYLQEDNTWSAWQDPFVAYKTKHWEHRYTGYAKLVLMQSTTLHNLYYENEEKFKRQAVLRGDTNSGFYKVLKYEAEQELLSKKIKAKRTKILVLFSSADKTQTKNYIYYFD